jgi:hypothetical protein
VLGAGLGYGAGSLLGHLLPAGYGDRLKRTGLILGGGLGAAPGLLWGLTNKVSGKDFNDPSLLQGTPDNTTDYPRFQNGANTALAPEEKLKVPEQLNEHMNAAFQAPELMKKSSLGTLYKQACVKTASASAFGEMPEHMDPSPMDVNINALGQTLYDQAAPPALAASTMGAMYAAQQLPDPRSRPGWATAGQLGQLARNAAGDYMKGLLVGAALNSVIGTPIAASTFGGVNAGLGIIGAVVPKLFGG